MAFIKKLSFQCILFIFFFGVLTCFVNSNNIVLSLPQLGIESIVERGHLYLEGSSTPELWIGGDVFTYKGHIYNCRQSGQFFIGSIVYFFLYKLGLTYKNNLILAGGLVTLCTSVIMTAIMGILLFNIIFNIIRKRKWSFIISCFFVFGTLFFPYSGVTYYDIYAIFFIFVAFYLLFLNYTLIKYKRSFFVFLAGFLIGIAIFNSLKIALFLPLWFMYIAFHKNWKELILYLFGVCLGLIPSLVYNFAIFNNPFTFPEMIYYALLHMKPANFSLQHVLYKLNFYFISPITAITFFSPIFLVGVLGLLVLPKRFFIEKIVLISIFSIILSQLLVVTASDWCSYGPRYLLCLMPFGLIGLSSFFIKKSNFIKRPSDWYNYLISFIVFIGIISIIICTVGSLIGIMNCDYNNNAFLLYLSKIISGELPRFPFVNLGFVFIFISIMLFLLKYPGLYNKAIYKINEFNDLYGMKWFYLSLILLSAFFLRTIKLDQIPLGLYTDEASIGYNAYCIAETGRDEYGELFPVYFKAFGEYKNPVIIYIAAILIKLYGPTVFVLRFSIALLGIITVFLTYKVVNLYFQKSVALLSAFLLVLSPWHIIFSREAGDATALHTFFLLGFYWFTLGLRSNSKYIIFSSVPIALSFYCYGVAKLFVPLFYLFFIAFNFKAVINKSRIVIACFLLVSIMLIPMIKTSFEKDIQGRFNMLSITNPYYSLEPAKKEFNDSNLSFLSKNKGLLITAIFLKNYAKHLSIDFLLKNGDRNLRHSIGNRGQLLKFTFYMSLIGFVFLLMKRTPSLYIFPLWFLLFPVPASLTWEGLPHAARTVCGLPVFEILAAVGFFYLWALLKRCFLNSNKLIGIVLSIFLCLMLIKGISDFGDFAKKYFLEYPKYSLAWFEYDAYAISKATENMKGYDAFIISTDSPQVNFLYWQKIDPKKWLADKNILKYVKGDYPVRSYINKKIARIVRPGEYPKEKTINLVYNEITNNVIYEVKEVKTLALKTRTNFYPSKTGGLMGEYFNGKNFDKLMFTRIDSTVNFNWGLEQPHELINNDNFSIRWSGWVNIEQPGSYSFTTKNDDGVRMRIDDSVIIDDWYSHPPKVNVGNIYLDKGWHVIFLEYFEDAADNIVTLEWQRPDGSKGLIPQNILSPDPIFVE